MATFGDLLTILRRDVIGEDDATYSAFSDADDLLPELYRASAELAAHAGFPVKVDSTITASAGDTSVTAPSDMVWPKAVLLRNDELELKDYPFVRRKQKLTSATWTRYFSYDPLRGGSIEFGPPIAAAVTAGDMTVEYVAPISTSGLTSASNVWGGLFPDFHYLVTYRAGTHAWDSVGEYEAAQYWNQRLNADLQGFAARLGLTTLPNLMVPSDRRQDEGEL